MRQFRPKMFRELKAQGPLDAIVLRMQTHAEGRSAKTVTQHYSGGLLLQSKIRRSVGQQTVSSMPPALEGSAQKPASSTLTRGPAPL
ncbi:hypothetical protein AYO43_04305 [Nitrospira sp. SCGC AG-212-E16]|nr:hypothetical protein AYO43_04305 [Nitrospira sp. SCGC AG-212-E16]